MKKFLLSLVLLTLSMTSAFSAEHRNFGWKSNPHHKKDLVQFVHHPSFKAAPLPSSASLQALMPPVYDQGQIGSCHDDQTEVLTDSGWKFFADLDDKDLLATVDPETRELIYEKPIRLIRMPYKGEMICVENHSVNFHVTPDHKMLVRKWDESKRTLSDKFEFVAAKDLGWYFGLMGKIVWNGFESPTDKIIPGVPHKLKVQRVDTVVSMDQWMRFLGIYIAEGTMLKKDQKKDCISYKVQIAGCKEREKDFIREVLLNIGLNTLELKDRFTFSNKRIYSEMESLGLLGVKAPFKYVPEFVFDLPASQGKEFLLGHFMGDGCEKDGHRSHYTSSIKLANDLQRLIFLSGDGATISIREPRKEGSIMKDGRIVYGKYPEHRVYVKECNEPSIDKKAQVFKEQYDGEVFCAEVPTYHTLVTRRSGKILVSGNCTANAGCAGFDYKWKVIHGSFFNPSRLDLYQNELKHDGNFPNDDGSFTTTILWVLTNQGVCSESKWPYRTDFLATNPPACAAKERPLHKAIKGYDVDNTDGFSIKQAIANAKLPVVYGTQVYAQIFNVKADAPYILMPSGNSEGGHEMILVAYDDNLTYKGIKGWYLTRNSWNTTWGKNGYAWISYAYIHNPKYTEDCMVIEQTN